jgi:hypothetical protein
VSVSSSFARFIRTRQSTASFSPRFLKAVGSQELLLFVCVFRRRVSL